MPVERLAGGTAHPLPDALKNRGRSRQPPAISKEERESVLELVRNWMVAIGSIGTLVAAVIALITFSYTLNKDKMRILLSKAMEVRTNLGQFSYETQRMVERLESGSDFFDGSLKHSK